MCLALSAGKLHCTAVMSETTRKNVVDDWLQLEAAAAPDSPVVSALNSATKSMKLDESAVLKNLRELYKEPPQPPEKDVEGKTD